MWNKQAEELLGFNKRELTGRLFLDVVGTDEKKAFEDVLVRALDGEDLKNYELWLKGKFGIKLCLLLNATMRRDENGEVAGVIAMAQDVTRERKREAQVDRLLTEATQLFETANAPIFGVDTNLRINEWNLKAETISEYSKEETMGKHILDLIEQGFQSSVKEVPGWTDIHTWANRHTHL